jgi:hypothetical protein
MSARRSPPATWRLDRDAEERQDLLTEHREDEDDAGRDHDRLERRSLPAPARVVAGHCQEHRDVAERVNDHEHSHERLRKQGRVER